MSKGIVEYPWESTRDIYQHIPPIHGLYNGYTGQYGVILGETTARARVPSLQNFPLIMTSLPETNSKSTRKWMVGIRSFPFESPAYFQRRTVSFREGNHHYQITLGCMKTFFNVMVQSSVFLGSGLYCLRNCLERQSLLNKTSSCNFGVANHHYVY